MPLLESFSRSGEGYGPVAITPKGLRAFVASPTTLNLLVFDLDRAECSEPSLALVNQYTGDGTLEDAKDTTSLTVVGQPRFHPGL